MNTAIANNPGASTEAIQYHYDVGNPFYQLWLDPTCTYSCGLWEEGDTLEDAQIKKLDYHLQQVRAKQCDRILDIGCGWGSIVKRFIQQNSQKQAIGLTLSQEQVFWINSLNLSGVEVKLESWTEHSPKVSYDGIISIGAFEHFAKPEQSKIERIAGYRAFFENCHQWLNNGGYFSLQTIAYGNTLPGQYTPFLGTEIFPESELPRLAEIAEASERLFEIVRVRNDPEDYKRTCQAWLSNLKQNRERAIALVGEETVARYEKYFNLCIIGFHTGKLELLRLTLKRIDRPAS